ncbi:MAG: A/G-specific adenine glycosylase [Flavobacterium sp.]|nr:A/G-specific adenine glycosylase [Flavobacterium sp.]
MAFYKRLIQWYLLNKRDLPWRNTTDPYAIWLSEIILQQTRVAQGLPYFVSFIDAFPTVFDLAAADEDQVLKLWQGLGYYSRARNLHKTAKFIAQDLGGVFPDSYAGLLKLGGVGPYTAAAIASFSYDEAVPVVDGNVYRVLARHFGIENDIAHSSARVIFTEFAASLMPENEAANANQAIMEFGALQCVPRNPDCQKCVMQSTCVAFKVGKVNELPVKSKKKPVKIRHFNYLLIRDNLDKIALRKRTAKDIWQNLYEFPLIETNSAVNIDDLTPMVLEIREDASVYETADYDVVHKLSHQHLHIKFWDVRVNGILNNGIATEDLHKYALPTALLNYVEKNWK